MKKEENQGVATHILQIAILLCLLVQTMQTHRTASEVHKLRTKIDTLEEGAFDGHECNDYSSEFNEINGTLDDILSAVNNIW